MNDTLAAALANIYNCELKGKSECLITQNSSMIKRVLEIMRDHKYIGEFEELSKEQGGLIKVNLIGGVNRCGVIKPRFSVKKDDYEKYEKRYLLAKGFGMILVSTSQGLMTHDEAIEKNIGGKLVAYCY